MPSWNDFLGPAVVTPLWILLGAVLGVHGLWKSPMTVRSRYLGLGAYGVAAIVLAAGSWWYGALQIETARVAEQKRGAAEKAATVAQTSFNNQLDQANNRLEQLQNSVDRLSLSSPTIAKPPRNLTQEEKRILIGVLAPFSSTAATVHIQYASSDARAYLYAQQWADVLVRSNWRVANVWDSMMSSVPIIGVQIWVKSKETAGAGVLQKAFRMIGINADGVINPDVATNEIDLTFGVE